MSKAAYRVVVAGFALYWLSLVYGCFVVHVVQPTDFFKESSGLLAGLVALHLKGPQHHEGETDVEQMNVRADEATIETPPGSFTKKTIRRTTRGAE